MRQAPDPFAKAFAWSYSRLKNYETCPFRHLKVDLLREIKEPESDALLWGNYLHNAMAKAIGTDDNDKRAPRDRIIHAPLPADMAHYQHWVDYISASRTKGATVLTECALAMTRDFAPCEWFSPAAWYRAKVDVLVLSPGVNVAATYDWKTGKRLDDSPQLAMTALLLFAHYPALEAVRAEFVWCKDMPLDREGMLRSVDRAMYYRADQAAIWNGLAGRVRNLEGAFIERKFDPLPSGLCRRWCPVTSCAHHGK